MRALAVLIAAGALTGVANAVSSTPATFARAVILQWTNGSPETAWASLHPAHQKVVSRGQFAHCVRANQGERVGRIRVRIGGWRKVTIARSEIPQRTGWSVRLVVTQQNGGVKDRETRRLEVVRVADGFRWLLDKRSFDLYRRAPSSMFCA